MTEPRLIAELIQEMMGVGKCWNCGTVARLTGAPPVCSACEDDPTENLDSGL